MKVCHIHRREYKYFINTITDVDRYVITPPSPLPFSFDDLTVVSYPLTISVQGNSLALEDPLTFNLVLEVTAEVFETMTGIIFDIGQALVTIEDLDGKGTNVHYLYIDELSLHCYVVLIVGIQEVPVSTEGDRSNVIVRRNLIEPSIPVFVTVTTRLAIIDPIQLLPGTSWASEEGRSFYNLKYNINIIYANSINLK